MKYHRKNSFVLVTDDSKYSIIKIKERCYLIRKNLDGCWGLGEFVLDSDGSEAEFFWLKTAKAYIENKFYKG